MTPLGGSLRRYASMEWIRQTPPPQSISTTPASLPSHPPLTLAQQRARTRCRGAGPHREPALRHRLSRCVRRSRFARTGMELRASTGKVRSHRRDWRRQSRSLARPLRGDGLAGRGRGAGDGVSSPVRAELGVQVTDVGLTVLCETDSSFAISGIDKLVGRERRTRTFFRSAAQAAVAARQGAGVWPAAG